MPERWADADDLAEEYEAAQASSQPPSKAKAITRAASPKIITEKQLDDRILKTCHNIGEWVGGVIKPLIERIEALEASQLKAVGIFKEGVRYSSGDLVTARGGLWLCRADTTEAPPGPSWRLMVRGTHSRKDADND